MRSMIVLAALALAGAAFAGGTYFAGSVTESEYENAWQQLEDAPDVRIVDRSYQSGVLGAEARTEIAPAGDALAELQNSMPEMNADDWTLVFTDRIRFGPVLTGADAFFGAAHSQGTVRAGEALAATVPALAGGEALLETDTTVGFDGSGRMRLTSPDREWQKAGTSVDVAGVAATVTWQSGGGAFTGSGGVDALAFQGEGGRARLTDLRFQGDTEQITERLWLGTSELRLAEVVLESDNGTVRLEGVDLSWSHEAAEEADEEGLLRGDLTVTFDRLESPDGAFSDGRLRASSRNVDQEAFDRLLALGDAVQRGDALPQQAMTGDNPVLGDLLARNPRLALDELRVQTPNGVLDGSASAAWSGGRPDMNNPFGMLSQVQADVTLEAPRALWQTLPMAQGPGLENLVRRGFVVRDGDMLRSELSLRNGRLQANGEDKGSVLQGLLGGF